MPQGRMAPCSRPLRRRAHLTLELQAGTARDIASATIAIPQIRRDWKPALAADAHASDAFIPTRDDTALAKVERDRRTPNARIELPTTLFEPPGVLHLDDVAGFCLVSRTWCKVDVLQAGGTTRPVVLDWDWSCHHASRAGAAVRYEAAGLQDWRAEGFACLQREQKQQGRQHRGLMSVDRDLHEE
jgi:hypothetical protein